MKKIAIKIIYLPLFSIKDLKKLILYYSIILYHYKNIFFSKN